MIKLSMLQEQQMREEDAAKWREEIYEDRNRREAEYIEDRNRREHN